MLLAQQTDPFAAGAKSKIRLPKSAIVGSNAERKAAWDRLSENEKSQLIDKFKSIFEQAKAKSHKSEKPLDTILTFAAANKSRRFVNAQTRETIKSKNNSSLAMPLRPEPCDGCEPPPDPNPTPTDQSSPIGFLDGIDVNMATINGWSFDPDNPSASNDVHIYINGPAGGGGIGFAITTNQLRPDVNQAYGN
ncbi:MAG: hypothetical protein ACR2N3_11360 [Pyrinomonadaceae bacterium]